MLSAHLRIAVDRAWDGIWSSGITNPIVVSDLLGTVLMAGSMEQRDSWMVLQAAVRTSNSQAIADELGAVRRRFGISVGSEFESSSFWRNTTPLVRAMEELEPVRLRHPDADVLGDIYEHVLSKLSLAGHFGQFRTPRHIVEFMVELVTPSQGEVVLDPACGSGGFLVAASNFRKQKQTGGEYLGVEIDRTVARIAAANLTFHGVSEGTIRNDDGLSPDPLDADVVLANPPFSGSVSDERSKQLGVRTRKTELLFLEAIQRQLRPAGRAAVIVPSGVLTGSFAAASLIRKRLATQNALRAVIELPSGVFRPYTDVRTAILLWKAGEPAGPTAMVRVENDGFSLDQRRLPTGESDLPAALQVLRGNDADIAYRCVDFAELAATGFNLNPSRYLEHREGGSEDTFATEEVLEELTRRFAAAQRKVAVLQKEIAND